MSGNNPYSAHSPTQPQYIYSSPPRNPHPPHPPSYHYNSEQYHPPQTPPPYAPSGPSRSPHFGHPPSPLTTALPSINGTGPPQDVSPPYQTNGSPPQYRTQRSYSGSYAANNPPPSGSHYEYAPTSHSHPSNHHDMIAQSPSRENGDSTSKPWSMRPPPVAEHHAPAEEKPVRKADPMSFASILSEPAAETPKKSSPPITQNRASFESNRPTSPIIQDTPTKTEEVPKAMDTIPKDTISKSQTEKFSKAETNGTPIAKGSVPKKPRKVWTEKEKERMHKEKEKLDANDMSDEDGPEFEAAKEEFKQQSLKRSRGVEDHEGDRRKRRCNHLINHLERPMGQLAAVGQEQYNRKHADAALAEVDAQNQQKEKERKKDQQRKRRREIGLKQETEKKQAAELKAKKAQDAAEREKYMREVEKATKKIRHLKKVMDGGDDPEEISEVTPLAPNLEGGTTGSFHIGRQMSPEPPAKKQKLGPVTRPKKSKEQKAAEIKAAEDAWEDMQRGEELVTIAPKGEHPREKALKKGGKRASESKEASPALGTTTYTSAGYLQIYDQIWKEAAKKDIPKVHRIKDNSLITKAANLRKTCQLASKEARRFQLRTNKSTKEDQARAKRCMREMMSFWKRNEREERDLRRMAEKQELENAKKAEADREANRQKRKLNFLISQTELYSHFIGRKIKTDEVERSTDDAAVAATEKVKDGPKVQLPDGAVGAKVTNFEDLDFDAEDDEGLRRAAMANAQNAVQEAQDRARAFNGEENMAALDDGEMNFQNPTSLGDVDVAQPKMLTAQLKEYQLKGLNWLVNLYEQGINGILADEMGLGKTIQSISVMAYLAEHHNIWGPFLVIAPASTLHNWQQEITRFVPNIKVLPYWGTAKDRKVLRKFWDRKHITYTRDSQFHVLVTSYQLVVQDTQYFQKVKWQYMILDEAQAIKSSSSSRWKNLLAFHCRNRLLLTGTPIQNNMQELWALLHFIMPTLFDSHDEFSDWFSKDIESHAQSNTKLNEDQLKRLHMILKPFMLRRIKKHVQKELGDKIEKDLFCDLTYRQRAYYTNLRNRISIMDIIEKAAVGDDGDASTLMNLVMQFRKVCNHPDLFERAETTSPFSMAHWAECASFLREGHNVNIAYSTRNLVEYDLPRMLCGPDGRLDVPGPENEKAGFENKYLQHMMNIWTPDNIKESQQGNEAFSWLRFADTSPNEAYRASHTGVFERALGLKSKSDRLSHLQMVYDEEEENFTPAHALFNIVERNDRKPLAEITSDGHLKNLLNVSKNVWDNAGLGMIEPCARPGASAPPIQISCSDQNSIAERRNDLFNIKVRQSLYGITEHVEEALLEKKVDPDFFPIMQMLPPPTSAKGKFTNIAVPSMRRFVTDSGKLGRLDKLLGELKNGGHRVLLYFQMTKMIDLIEEYLTYRNYKYLRLDGSTKLEDRRDYVHDFQTRPEIFIFLLSTRAGGLGINLTAADTVIFYDSDWNPTIDSQAMDRAHRLGQTKQVTVYRMITRGTIEERIRKRALQKEEVQRVVISGGSGGGVDFNTRSRENRTKDIAMWLADDDQAELIEQKEKEMAEKEGEAPVKKGRKSALKKKKDVTLDDMYHEGEGHFDDQSNKPSGAATPVSAVEPPAGPGKGKGKRGPKGTSKRAKTMKERLRVVDADGDLGMGGA